VNIRRCLGVLAASFLLAQGLAAQTRSSTSKLLLTFGLNGTSINAEGGLDQDETGPGIHFGAGWGFSPRFAAFLDFAGASIDTGDDDYVLSHVDLGLRFHFANSNKAFIPYLEGAFTGRSAKLDEQNVNGNDDVDVEISGGGFTLGGGILYFFNPKWAFNAHLKWTTGEFSRVRVENVTVDGFEVDARTLRLGIGLTWFPMGSR
jgi:hypothetical protein